MVVLNKRSKGGKGVESVDDEELYNIVRGYTEYDG